MFSKFQENWGWEYLQFRISTRNVHYYLKDDFSQPEKKFFPNYKILIIVLGFSTKKACQRSLNSPFFFFPSKGIWLILQEILNTMEKGEVNTMM